jgi:hypothetical protein
MIWNPGEAGGGINYLKFELFLFLKEKGTCLIASAFFSLFIF